MFLSSWRFKEKKSGVLYVASRDEKFCPIVFLCLSRIKIAQLNQSEAINAFVFFIKVVKEYMLVPYFVENFKLVIDFTNTDLGSFKEVEPQAFLLISRVDFKTVRQATHQ